MEEFNKDKRKSIRIVMAVLALVTLIVGVYLMKSYRDKEAADLIDLKRDSTIIARRDSVRDASLDSGYVYSPIDTNKAFGEDVDTTPLKHTEEIPPRK
jgi:hypothetical protein